LKELADFEWVQYWVRSARDGERDDWINPTLLLRCYQYPVIKWYDQFEMQERQFNSCNLVSDLRDSKLETPLTLAIFRHPTSSQVKTMELHPAAAELFLQWTEGGTPEISAQTLAHQLGYSAQLVLDQMKPLLNILIQEGALLHEGRKSTRNFFS
jgi:hypothetical protein